MAQTTAHMCNSRTACNCYGMQCDCATVSSDAIVSGPSERVYGHVQSFWKCKLCLFSVLGLARLCDALDYMICLQTEDRTCFVTFPTKMSMKLPAQETKTNNNTLTKHRFKSTKAQIHAFHT